MAARVAKNIIRALLREKMKQLKVPSSEPYRQLVLLLFNLFSGHHQLSSKFWTATKSPRISSPLVAKRQVTLLDHSTDNPYFTHIWSPEQGQRHPDICWWRPRPWVLHLSTESPPKEQSQVKKTTQLFPQYAPLLRTNGPDSLSS